MNEHDDDIEPEVEEDVEFETEEFPILEDDEDRHGRRRRSGYRSGRIRAVMARPKGQHYGRPDLRSAST